MPEAHALLALWNDVAPGWEAAYDDWHAREHVPERLTVPGILWACRYGEPAPGTMARYLTLYGLQSAAVLASAPYQRLLREPTPASAAMRPRLERVSRWVCTLLQPATAPRGDRLVVQTLPRHADPDWTPTLPGGGGAVLIGRREPDAPGLPWLSANQHDEAAGGWLVCGVQDDAGLPGAVAYRRLPIG